MSINQIILVGNAAADPTIKEVGRSKKATLRLATQYSKKNSDGEWENVTDWHSIAAWNDLAENMAKKIHKGGKVMITGRLTYDRYTNTNGVEVTVPVIMADRFETFNPPATPDQSTAGQPQTTQRRPASPAPAPSPAPAAENYQDDLPF